MDQGKLWLRDFVPLDHPTVRTLTFGRNMYMDSKDFTIRQVVPVQHGRTPLAIWEIWLGEDGRFEPASDRAREKNRAST